MIPHIHTQDGLNVVIRGRPYAISAHDKAFDEAVELLQSGTEEEFDELINRLATVLEKKLHGIDEIEYSCSMVTYNGEVLHNFAADRLIGLIEAGRNVGPLKRFLAKLLKNPSKRVVDRLYEFLEHGQMPLTEDGDFLAYKAVRQDYRDIHSNTFFNRIGDECSMPRNRVDEDQDRTCSAGLHVCSYDYLPSFSHAGGHVMVVKIDPADVVAIPRDYENTKMRVCRYTVIEEVEGWYSDRHDVLGETGRGTGVYDPLFSVYYGEEGNERGDFYTMAEAKVAARKVANEYWEEAWVEDEEGMVVWSSSEHAA